MAKILNFGSLNIDYVYTLDHFVTPGETIQSQKRQIFAGGKGLNQSLAAKRAGSFVYHAGCVGLNDSDILLDTLNFDGVDTSFIKKVDSPSGHTVIQVNKEGQNCIILFGGSNHKIECDDIDKALDNFNVGDYLILQNEINNLEYIINKASAKGLKICFNVSPFEPRLLDLPLHKCSYLIVNEIEGAGLVQCDPNTAPLDLIDKLASVFTHTNIVITFGVNGSYYKGFKDKESVFVESFKVDAIDTTAAGDTYLGYFISMLANGSDIKKALQYAAAASALAVTKQGASPSIPKLCEVLSFLKQRGIE